MIEYNNCYYVNIESKHKGTKAQYCRICGMSLYKLPFFIVGKYRQKVTICPWCILEKTAAAQELINHMDSILKDDIELNRFVHNL